MSNKIPVITIDGPGGSGKGTIGLRLATQMGWHFLDSGCLYRVLALQCIKLQVSLDDEADITQIAKDLRVEFKPDEEGNSQKIFLDNYNVGNYIRSEKCASVASQISAFGKVRKALVARQRAFRQAPGLVTDGRDMGTVIFPNAEIKFYFQASAEERAKRRYKQLNDKGISVNLLQILIDIEKRDTRDKQRSVAPLKPADDAVLIDTTTLSVDAVFKQVLSEVAQRGYSL